MFLPVDSSIMGMSIQLRYEDLTIHFHYVQLQHCFPCNCRWRRQAVCWPFKMSQSVASEDQLSTEVKLSKEMEGISDLTRRLDLLLGVWWMKTVRLVQWRKRLGTVNSLKEFTLSIKSPFGLDRKCTVITLMLGVDCMHLIHNFPERTKKTILNST